MRSCVEKTISPEDGLLYALQHVDTICVIDLSFPVKRRNVGDGACDKCLVYREAIQICRRRYFVPCSVPGSREAIGGFETFAANSSPCATS